MLLSVLFVYFLLQVCESQTPGPPSNLRGYASTETSLSVTWTAGSAADTYVVSWSAIQPFTTPPREAVVSLLNYTIEGLSEGTRYTVTVASQSSGGSRSTPISDDFTTDSTTPSSAPTAFTVAVLSDTSIRLTWRAPPVEHWNSIQLSRYTFCFDQRTTGNTFSSCSTSSSVSANGDINFVYSRDVTGLQPLTEYLCSVYVTNSQGRSPNTPEISVTTAGNENTFFELSFQSFFECQEWIRTYSSTNSLYSDMVYYIRANCNCNFNGNGGGIDMSEVSCRSGDMNRVVARARVVAPSDASLSNIMQLIDDWKYRSRNVLVSGQRLDIDIACPSRLGSVNDADCYNPAGAIAGGILGTAAFILLIVLVVIGVVCIARNWKRMQFRKKSSHLYVRSSGEQAEIYTHSSAHYETPSSRPATMSRTRGYEIPMPPSPTQPAVSNGNNHESPVADGERKEVGDSFEKSGISDHYEVDPQR